MTPLPKDLKPFDYVDVGPKIPNYTPGAQWGTQGEPLHLMQKPLSPEESQKHFVTPVGFKVHLYAAEPDLGPKPIAMNWDERGRLWVCETVDYPNELKPPGRGRDRIRICEDTDRDGRADRFTVFAENLSIPTAIAFYRGGAIVQNGTQTLYLKDTDGDDKADLRKVLISGWSLDDTHGGVSNIRYGLDGWFWAMQGYNRSEPIIDGEKQPGFRMGFFRFRLDDQDPPQVTDLEFIRSTSNNTWGLGISEEGLIFGSTANRHPSYFMPIPNRYYEAVRGWTPDLMASEIADTHLFQPITEKVRQVDHHGGYTAGAGHALYTARAYPRPWWNRTAFVCGPTGHLVGTFLLSRHGADFRATSPLNLLASNDEWSAPVSAEVGPDGSVWVLDWYNYIVQHNPTPRGFKKGQGNAYETDLRDKKHGRIYRVVYGDASSEATQWEPLSTDDPQELIETLQHPTMLWRLHAQRLLIERAKRDVVPALLELVRDQSTDEIGLNVGAIHALHALEGLGALELENVRMAVEGALKHPSAGVRRNVLQVLPRDESATQVILESGVLEDSDTQVRLAARLALAEVPTDPAAGKALAALLGESTDMADRWLSDALICAAARHALPFIEAISRAPHDVRGDTAHSTAAIVAEHIARGRPTEEELSRIVLALRAVDAPLAEAVIAGLAEGWPSDHRVSLSERIDTSLSALLQRLPTSAKAHLVRLAPNWGSDRLKRQATQIAQTLLSTIADESRPDAERVDAAQQLVDFRPTDPETVARLLELLTPQSPPKLVQGVIETLAESRAENVGPALVERAPEMTPSVRQVALGVLLNRPQTTRALLTGIEDGVIPLSDLSLEQRQALSRHPDEAIRKMARKLLQSGGGLPNPDRQQVLTALLPVTERTGDVTRGQEVFKEHCAKCHVHGGEGERIGPDLTGMAVHPKAELLTHIIDPSRSVEGNYRSYTVLTGEGRILTGMLAGESRTAVELVDTEGKRHALKREEIERLIASRQSIMPNGFEKQMTRQELADLLEFLTARGRFVPLPLGQVATAVSTRSLFDTIENGPDRLIFEQWGQKTVHEVPFLLVDPHDGTRANIILLHGPRGTLPPKMPERVRLPCNMPASAVHFLSGISGWGYPAHEANSVSMTVRLHYADGKTEDHPLKNGVHFADYIRRVDVPESKFAARLRGGRQIRYFRIQPRRSEMIAEIELVSGDDPTSPIVMAVTVESRDQSQGSGVGSR